MQKVAKAIQTDEYFSHEEITAHLENVEYIVMAAPAPSKFKSTPIHFTIFLNTKELPSDVIDAVLDKFRDEYAISEPKELLAKPMSVGFSQSKQDTPIPLLLIKPADIQSIAHVDMFVYDFLANSDKFEETKVHGLTGWSYSYN